jgi:SM-20-related protein
MHGTIATPLIEAYDDILPDAERAALNEFLHVSDGNGWKFGWKSHAASDTFSFWHRHFGGYRNTKDETKAYDCSKAIEAYPLVYALWQRLAEGALAGHRLIRCYANGHTYGSDGTLHTDSTTTQSYTSIYYPHRTWQPNWAGETVFFNEEKNDIIGSAYPRPNRLVIFDGRIPHLARGVSRTCPVLRVTLMFKTDIPNDPGN